MRARHKHYSLPSKDAKILAAVYESSLEGLDPSATAVALLLRGEEAVGRYAYFRTFGSLTSLSAKKIKTAIAALLKKGYLTHYKPYPYQEEYLLLTEEGEIEAKGMLQTNIRKKEKKLYALSDYIGCMSPANVEYVISHNPEIEASRVEVAPNSLELTSSGFLGTEEKDAVRSKYRLPLDKPVFIYGGNLGKPQGIPFLIECLKANAHRTDCHFLVIGTGTEYDKIDTWFKSQDSGICITVMEGLPKAEYDELVRACDVGLIFLDHRFTIPNFPSRLLSYLENKMPVLCATDPNTDMGMIAERNGFGFWCESDSVEAFTAIVDRMILADRKAMGEKGFAFLKENYLVENTYHAIMRHYRF